GGRRFKISYLDNGNNPSTTPTKVVLEKLPGATTSTSLAASPVSPPGTHFGEPVTFTATVTPAAGSQGGTVTFYDGDLTKPLTGTQPVPVTNGKASLKVTNLSVGTHNIFAVYSGNGTQEGSKSAALSYTVGEANSTLTVSTALQPAPNGMPVKLT